jgi:hypothetical protein
MQLQSTYGLKLHTVIICMTLNDIDPMSDKLNVLDRI